jgi:hypothetical protein
MINRDKLLKDLQRLLPRLEQDILAYTQAHPERLGHLKDEYAKAKEANRTSEHFVDWRAAQVTQSAAAWVLSCVFIRFLEDNMLLPDPVLAGPAGDRLKHAKDRQTVYFNEHPTHAEREYLLQAFDELNEVPVMARLLDPKHNPLWQLPVSADGAKMLIDFFQSVEPETGEIQHDFTDPNWDTRFLGDLYQDISESVRKRYALLQTPEFVESFILDYTLEKALDTFGLPGLRMIDPTCGSGHFLLTGFERLFEAWVKREPGTNARHLAQKALDAIHGVDINPYAVAIARFRLLIAAMKAAGSHRIKDTPDFQFHLAVGDSLLHGQRHEWTGQGHQQDALDDPIQHVLEVEDKHQLEQILGQRYHVVVGNPPYITVKDKALNQAYRDKYTTCHRKYSLGVPFTERFFDLCASADDHRLAGYVGMITANSFMKREFGKKLIEDYLPRKNLTHVIDTSGAHIPGHGTPTVILFARNQVPQGDEFRAVLGIRGEPSTPDDAAQGKVWRSIVDLMNKPGEENEFVSVANQRLELYAQHPWSLGGGGAGDLKTLLESETKKILSSEISVIGFGAILGEDDAFGIPVEKVASSRFPATRRPLIEGEFVRDWGLSSATTVLFPYDDKIMFGLCDESLKYLWPLRTPLWSRNTFGKQTYKGAGRSYAEYHQIPVERNQTPLSITFSFVSTHNHFVLDRGGKVFKQSAPVIKLPKGATETEHLSLLGLLNSSTACFWMKQVFHGKHKGDGGEVHADPAYQRFEFAGTGLKGFPLASDLDQKAQQLAESLDRLAMSLAALEPTAVLAQRGESPAQALNTTEVEAESIWQQMIALQEELDWCVYNLYGLINDDLSFQGQPPPIRLGERSFEIALARKVKSGETETTWFVRHGSTPVAEMPQYWPSDYLELCSKRLKAIEENRWIRLIEQPEYKRRWNREPWAKRQQLALREWLLNDLEARCHEAQLQTCAQLAERARHDAYFQQIAALYTGTDTFDVQTLVSELVATDQVPQFANGRYKPNAMAKFRAWQETWDKQRQEDAIDARTALDQTNPDYLDEAAAQALKARQVGDIPLPPKYGQADFRKPSYWPLRGKLDVPKERFFSLPGCEKPGDGTLVIGWAGLDHLQRAQAIAAWYLDRKEQDAWNAEQLMPMLVALDELIPWLKQWHNDLDPEYGERLGDYYEAFLLEELRQLNISRDELTDWEMPVATRGRRRTNA